MVETEQVTGNTMAVGRSEQRGTGTGVVGGGEQACNSSFLELEAVGSEVQSQLQLCRKLQASLGLCKTLFQKAKTRGWRDGCLRG